MIALFLKKASFFLHSFSRISFDYGKTFYLFYRNTRRFVIVVNHFIKVFLFNQKFCCTTRDFSSNVINCGWLSFWAFLFSFSLDYDAKNRLLSLMICGMRIDLSSFATFNIESFFFLFQSLMPPQWYFLIGKKATLSINHRESRRKAKKGSL